MKLDANVTLYNESDTNSVVIAVDADYVSPNASDVKEYVRNELEEMFGHRFDDEDFDITNLETLLEDWAFDEFERKTQYANM